MRAREMHPLCCISIDCPGIGGGGDGERSGSPMPSEADLAGEERRRWEGNAGSEGVVAGFLYKWTNYGKGWRCRWFTLRGGVLSYAKIRSPEQMVLDGEGVRLIGDPSLSLHRIEGGGGGRGRKPRKAVGVVRLKISSFRESRSDDRRFYIFSSTKTLHLRTDTKSDRVAWIEALVSARRAFFFRSLTGIMPCFQNDESFSTEKLRSRLLEEGISEALVKDCENIMQLEFSRLRSLYQDKLSLLPFRQVEDVNVERETTQIDEDLHLMKNDFSDSGRGKYSEYSTTESSDVIEKQEIDELSEEDELSFFDSKECFSESPISGGPTLGDTDCKALEFENWLGIAEMTLLDAEFSDHKFPLVVRRQKLPEPVEREKGVSLWSMIKDNVGKDLTRVCLPVYFNEPLSSLQKCFEDLEYSYLLDRAYDYGKKGNSLMRILNVAAFAVSGYASSEGRHCKPFNPLLGETYEADYPEKGARFFSEKVSHHPTVIACHCEGRGWKFWGDSNLRTKFWGRSIQLDPVGVLTLEFDDGEIFQWSKVTTTIYNLIFGKVYCDHHGTMHIHGNRQYSCMLKFKGQSILDCNPHQVLGFVEDAMGTKHATLMGKWDDSMYYVEGDATSKIKGCNPTENASLIWKRNKPPVNPTRYNLSSFAITLNELTSELQARLPPTDSRLRPDQRHLENGEYEKANAEKLRLEKRQRMSKKLQENGWKPRWFRTDSEDGTFCYIGGYWEAREQKKWDGCLDIFGEFSDDVDATSSKTQRK